MGLASQILARLVSPILDRLDRGIVSGSIEAFLPGGERRLLGGRGAGPSAILKINRWNALLRMASGGSVGCYEGWERGEWESPDLVPLFDVFMRNRVTLGGTARASGLSRLAKRIAHGLHRNDRKGAKRNIMAHYDLGNDFYASWLDATMSYSSARFVGAQALEAGQAHKMAKLTERLALNTPSSILEIGCGWGHFARSLVERGHAVTAVTISPAQKDYAEAHNPGPDYQLLDYRDVSGSYDAIASVEMVEAVGQHYWPTYLDVIARSLKPGGRAAIQFIAINDDVFERYASSADFIQAYIFPGGMLLSERRFRALAEARGLRWEAPEHFGLDYAETLRHWHDRFEAAVAAARLPAHFDSQFINLWRFYLQYCEGGFRGGGIEVGQVTLIKQG
ncbi:MAG: class I SAM-dependent methyltransferase [Sphingomonadaceae bacterium]